MSKLEQVAVAVAVAQGCGLTVEGKRVMCDDATALAGLVDGYGEPLCQDFCRCRASARAALSVIREPDEGMVERIASDDDELSDALHDELQKQRAWSIEKHGQVALATYPFAKIVAARLWTAMIDHILSETKP